MPNLKREQITPELLPRVEEALQRLQKRGRLDATGLWVVGPSKKRVSALSHALCRVRQQDYALRNKERITLKQRDYNELNREQVNRKSRERSKRNDVMEKRNARNRERYRKDECFAIYTAVRCRITKSMRGTAKARTAELLGCELPEFKKYIAKQFTKGMSWSNYGDWHLDHRIPCAKFDLSKPEQLRQCFNFRNYQPLWAVENIRKGAVVERPTQIPLGL